MLKSSEDLLANDHKYLHDVLSSVWLAINNRDSVKVFDRLDLFWARLAVHIRAENLHLFPSIINQVKGREGESELEYLRSTEVQKAIERLTADHNFFVRELSRAIGILREADIGNGQFGSVQQIVGEVGQRLTSHNELEEAIIYQQPAKLLSPDEQIELATRIQHELEKLPPRFS